MDTSARCFRLRGSSWPVAAARCVLAPVTPSPLSRAAPRPPPTALRMLRRKPIRGRFRASPAARAADAVERTVDDSAADAREHIAEAANVEQTARGVGAGGAQEDVIGLMPTQHVVNKVGRDR